MRRLWSGAAKDRKVHNSVEAEETEDVVSKPVKLKSNGNSSTTKSNNGSSGGKTRTPRSKPLSKYRRITANARERDRMKEINTAFATLRAVLPTFTNCRISSMTKYTTLQLAASYIRGLSELLEETPSNNNCHIKENRPSYCNASNVGRDINLSVGISEIPFDRTKQTPSESIQSNFNMYSNTMNNFNTLNDNQLDALHDIDNLNDMCWTLDFMLE